MTWTTPTFIEIKMDAEVSAYQEDQDPCPIVEERLHVVQGEPSEQLPG